MLVTEEIGKALDIMQRAKKGLRPFEKAMLREVATVVFLGASSSSAVNPVTVATVSAPGR